MINVTFPDGSTRKFEKGIEAINVAKSISERLAKEVLAVEINGEVKDIRTTLEEDANVTFLKFEDEGGKKTFWHTTSHILAQAVKRLYPETKLAIGPSIDNGFYYDFDREAPFTEADLEKLEKEMERIVKEDITLSKFELPREEAIAKFKDLKEDYKVELVEDLPADAIISFYKQDDFTDLCAGPHINSTGAVKAIKLTSLAGAYWRGDEKRQMLQRIYGISFPKKAMLDDYLEKIEEAKKRDHRKLGKELDLFSILEEGPGFPFFHPKGMILRNELESFWRKQHELRGYEEVRTPIILDVELWKRSGHWDNYKENMYFTKIDDRDFAIKPMNCPGGILIYKRKIHSYKDLPIRMAELGLVHRHEKSGALHGLMRVRNFTQDDAHIFMTEEQITDELIGVIDFTDYMYSIFGFKYNVELSTRPEKSIGSEEQWEIATNALKKALEKKGVNYVINEGDGAFYGPKIDFHLEDSLGRTWQCGTIQLDFQMPERFDLTYIGSDGEKHRPIMIHRTIFGSIERFIGILTEHFAGAFPVWLAPVQAMIIPVNEDNNEYALNILNTLKENDIRVDIDLRNEKLGYKIREAQMQKIPYMLVIGKKEVENNLITARSRKEGDLGQKELNEFIDKINEEIKNKKE